MPAKRSLVESQTVKKFVCDRPHCTKSFTRSNDLLRHKDSHLERSQRRYGCPLPHKTKVGSPCEFRANQLAGLQAHMNTHLGKRLPCPFCRKDFSDPSCLSVHKKSFHSQERNHGPSAATLPLQLGQAQLESGPGASSTPSRVNSTSQTTTYKKTQSVHQGAYDAHHPDAAQTVWGIPQNAASSSSGPARRGPTITRSLTRSPGMANNPYYKLAPIRGEEWNGESETLPSLSYVLGTGHVPRSSVPRNDIQIGPSDYCRVIPEMLF